MSADPVPELEKASSSELSRIYSDETDETPFASNLVTPFEGTEVYQGIEGRLEAAKSALSYFDSKELSQEIKPDSVQDANLEVAEIIGEVGEVGRGDDCGPAEHEKLDETSHSLLIALDSSTCIASPVMSSSSMESVHQRQPGLASFYNLPNDHISIEPNAKDTDSFTDDEVRPLMDSDSIPVFKEADLGARFWTKELGPAINSLTCTALVSIAIRLVCFLPWCVAVGGALLFSPEHLELLAFRTGYIEALSGIRRYAHWATYGFQHIAAFLAFLAIMTWFAPTAGLICIGGLMAQFCWAWHTFLLDRNIPLGEDDKQTIYLLATSTWLNSDTTINIRKIGDSYFIAEGTEDVVTGAIPVDGDESD